MLLIRVLTIFFVVHFSAASFAAVPVFLGTQSLPPYQESDGRTFKGIAVDSVSCIFKYMKQDYTVKDFPLLRSELATREGRLDGFFTASQCDKCDEYAVLAKTFIQQEWRIYFLNHMYKESDYRNIRDFYRLGARLHSDVAYWAQKKKYIVQEYAEGPLKLIQLLQADRIDAYVENRRVFEHHLKKLKLNSSDFYSLHFMNKKSGVYFGKKFLKNNPGFLKKFSSAVDQSPCFQ